jgi:hypothetical protein
MWNLKVSIVMVVAIAACGGPGGRDVAIAKTTRYQGDKLQLFAAMKSATEGKYKLAQSDETTLTVQTVPKWYTPEGLIASAGDQDMQHMPDKSIRIVLVAKLVPDGDKWVVVVEPKMLRYFAGRPNPDNLPANDPSVPGYATGKVDELAYDIYASLKQWEVKSTDGMAPAPTPAGPPPAGSGG